MELFGPVCGFTRCLWPPLAERLGYIKDFNENLKKMNKEMKDLCTRREDIKREINRDKMSKTPSKECQDWLEEVETIINQVNDIEAEVNANRRCLHRCCFPDIMSRKKLGKHIVTTLNDLTRLKEASAFRGGVVVDAALEIVERIPAPVTVGQTSTDLLLQHILGCIRDYKIQKIGLWGMGGVGKTTVMKILNNLPENERTFEIVIWVNVSKEGSVRKVQNEIANRLQINIMDNESDEAVAGRIFRRLETLRYLLLLDDVWSQVNLEEVGIPKSSTETGSKMVLTTRYRDVCKKMDTDEEIKVEVLSKEEAWSLFHEKVGDVLDSPDIEPIAKHIVEECDGLPLAVLVIGGSLRKVEDVHVWKNALEELKLASFEIGDMEDLVFQRLKFSYDRLKNENVKNCFLYCALYPEDYEIPVAELVEHWRAEGFVDSIKYLDRAYDKAHTILNSLADGSLLERTGNHVKMHDVVRDLALRITFLNGKGPRFLVRAGLGIEECPDVEEWEETERISLMHNKLRGLPTSPRCDSLLTLLLPGNYWRLKNIPDLFFQNMHNLRVLNLCNTGLRFLPSSVCHLVNLRGLYLVGGPSLETLPSEVGALKRLEVLYVCVKSLPLEFGQLSNLRYLNMTFSGVEGQAMRAMCSNGFISSFSLLEDLRIGFERSELLSQWCKMIDIPVAEEVGSLKHLTSLRFEFSTVAYLDHFLKRRHQTNSPEWKGFQISVSGSGLQSFSKSSLVFENEMRETVKWHFGEEISSEIVHVLKQARHFELYDHKTTQSLSDFDIQNNKLQSLDLRRLPNLRSICDAPHSLTALTVLVIQKCPKLRCVFTPSMAENVSNLKHLAVQSCENIEEIVMLKKKGVVFFPRLKSLELEYLHQLVTIWKGDPESVFKNLTCLRIHRCSKLKSVFAPGMIQKMRNLEELIVEESEEIEEIVTEEVEKSDAVQFFPRLKILNLRHMDKIVRIWNGVSQAWPSLEQLQVSSCPNLKSLTLADASALKKIEGGEYWWNTLEWENVKTKQRLQPLFKKQKPQPPRDYLYPRNYHWTAPDPPCEAYPLAQSNFMIRQKLG